MGSSGFSLLGPLCEMGGILFVSSPCVRIDSCGLFPFLLNE